MNNPKIIKGDLAVDDRGEVGYVNDFTFHGVKRFYTVKNHRQGFIRAWHGHRNEGKYVTVVEGSALLCAVQIDNWDEPSRELSISKYIMSDNKPAVIYIPPGYANGFMSLSQNAKLIFYSTSTLSESMGDDHRYDSRYWNPWNIEER
jgi:dTDP-4-dehydrorhamnose 3,5-epimerase-like enzyme